MTHGAPETGTKMDGGRALITSLELEGVEVIFGLPGGAILPVYDPIIDSPIRHILVRHEQGAGHMAEGYAQATGRPGVAMVTSGPVRRTSSRRWRTPSWTRSRWSSSPARWARRPIGTDAFQEADTTGITMPVTKHNFLVDEPPTSPAPSARRSTSPRPVARARCSSTSRRTSSTRTTRRRLDWYWPETVDLPGYNPTSGRPGADQAAAELIVAAESPCIYAGGGI